jgi:hypothetical protein
MTPDLPPQRSEQIALELAALPTGAPSLDAEAPLALVVAADADVRTYVRESLHSGTALAVLETGSVAAALEVALHRTPRVLVVSHGERAVVRHLPGVPAVILADETPAADLADARRLAPLIVVRGAFRAERLLEVIGRVLANAPSRRSPP